MTPDDFDQAALDLDLHRRAGARCAAAEPHRHPGEDWPCRRCVMAVQVQIAIASELSAPAPASSQCGSPQPRTEGASGGSGRVLGPPSGQAGTPTPKSNQPPALNEGLAERATELAQEGA